MKQPPGVLFLVLLWLAAGCGSASNRELARSAAIFAAGAVIGGASALAVQKACRCP